jgi:hypothetical protein
MIAKVSLVLGALVVAVVVGLLFLGGSITPTFRPVGRDAMGPEGSINLILPMGGDISCPESGDDPCFPSPIPTIDPVAAGAGEVLTVQRTSVKVDHTGAYSIPLGTAVLPNGVLTEASAMLADNVRPDLGLKRDVVYLRVTGEDGSPRGNKWSDGWHPGTETVHVTLEFTVDRLDTPATLELTDIVVR